MRPVQSMYNAGLGCATQTESVQYGLRLCCTSYLTPEVLTKGCAVPAEAQAKYRLMYAEQRLPSACTAHTLLF